MDGMSQTQRARPTGALTPAVLLRLITLSILIAVLGTLAAHHSDSAPAAQAAIAAQSAIAAESAVLGDTLQLAVSVPAAAEHVVQSAGDWSMASAVTGCVALGLCCVLGLALAKRATAPRQAAQLAPLERLIWPAVSFWKFDSADQARPSLTVLSISRT